MSVYINANANVSVDDFLALFKNLYHYIKGNLIKKESCEELSFEELVEKYSNDKDFLDFLDYIKTSLNDIAKLMRNLSFPYGEYYNFMSINNMITYIANDVGKYLKYSSFVLTLLREFNDLLDNQNNSDYDALYEEFDIRLDGHEDYFYTQIFDGSNEYDELIVKVTNILE